MPTTFRSARLGSSVSIVLLLASVATAAVPPSDTLLPRTTKGYLSIARPKEFDDRWNKTQIGQMFNDDVMKAFVDDFKKQMREDFGAIEKKLGLTYDDLKGVTGGEMSLSLIERKGQDAALAITIDVTGHQKQGDDMIAAAANRFAKRNGRRSTANVDGTRFEIFSVPTSGNRAQQTIYFIKDNLLCGIDDRAEAERILRRMGGRANDNLASLKAYQATMEKCRGQAGNLEPEARWFVDPFGFIFADRTLHEPSKKDQDLAKILYNNGFDAIQGAGGFLNQLVEGHVEILSRTAVYAPPVRGKENDPLRWNSSMQMMQMPNGPAVEPQSFAPRELAAYMTFNIKVMDAFDHVGPVFDALQDHEDAWKNTLEGWKNDPYGQQVDVRKEFIANMNDRVTVMSSYDMPITEESERSVFAIEAKNEAALAKTLERWMAKEPDVVKHQVDQYVIYEHVEKANAESEPDVEVPGFSPVRTGSDEKTTNAKKRKERVLPNSAVTVALGHMMMASDVNYLTEILQSVGRHERLASSADYQQMTEVMNRLAPGERSGWIFGRSDEELRPTFDLIREGKMPQSKSMLGKLLNKMLTTADEEKQGTPRRQRVNGANLPDFEMVRRYFGPHASVVKSEKDGWFITAALLNKEAP